MTRSHSGSDDSNDSRKRHSDDQLDLGRGSKRQNCGASPVHLKVLIPSIAAGAVIGKDGEAIERIQKETGAKVKMSKRNDFYPGTQERICLIVGSLEAVTATHLFVMERIYEKSDSSLQSVDGRLILERHKQVKVLVPNSTAGMIIGKNGAYIQEIKERSEAYVQISQKSREFSLPERCVIVAGDLNQMRAAMDLIIAVIASDHQSSSCPNLTYSEVRGPVSSVYPIGSPYAMPLVPPAVFRHINFTPFSSQPISSMDMLTRFITNQGGGSGDSFNVAFSAAQSSTAQSLAAAAAVNAFIQMGGGLGNAPVGLPLAVPTTSHNQVAAAFPNSSQQQQQIASQFGSFCASPVVMTAPNILETIIPTSQLMGANGISMSGIPLSPFCPMPGSPQSPPYGLQSQLSHAANLNLQSQPAQNIQMGAATNVALAAAMANTPGMWSLCYPPSPAGNKDTVTPTNPFMFAGGHQRPPGMNFSNEGQASRTTDSDGYWSGGMEELKCDTGISSIASTPSQDYLSSSAALMGLYVPPATNFAQAPLTAGGLLCRRELLIPESLIGRILGPQGRTLSNLQRQTGTVIRLSQQGVYMPGTQSRIVSISGDQMGVRFAMVLIEEAISPETNQSQFSDAVPEDSRFTSLLVKSNGVVDDSRSLINTTTSLKKPTS